MGSGWEEGEFEFKLVFEEEPSPPPPPPPPPPPSSSDPPAALTVSAAGPESSNPGSKEEGEGGSRGSRPEPNKNNKNSENNDSSSSLVTDNHLAAGDHAGQPISIPSPPPSTNQRAGMHSPPPRRANTREFSGTYESLPARSVQVSESRVVECPSIQITTISPEDEPASSLSTYWDMSTNTSHTHSHTHSNTHSHTHSNNNVWDRERLYLPLLDPFSYRDRCPAGSLSPSPASSPSSRGWLSPASSCDSLLVEEEELNLNLNDATSHFGLNSPSSRPTSPGGKKRRNSPLASPCDSRRGSYSDADMQIQGGGGVGGVGGFGVEVGVGVGVDGVTVMSQAPPPNNSGGGGGCELSSVPQKTRKTSFEQLSPREGEQEHSRDPRDGAPSLGMDYLSVPPALAWGRTRASAHSPLFRTTALPPLDWPLPSQFDQLELRIEVQPRPHHRAHYETEGSRGAVKAAPSGHPIVKLCGYTERKPLSLQVFVGTADDRSIRPHPFYQIHRVTGKMVGTASHESVQAGTKILDIPLSADNNMTALIDCAGILKLRNSDIELRKGETDVGRKNTRVRLVFRTHLPLPPPLAPPGRVLALQVASLPIECSQRSAQELPVVESVSVTSCCVEGGEELILSGANFLSVSRVLFMERGTDGKLQWEEEALVDRDNSNECVLCVRVPAYSDLSVSRPVSVSLYVSNGKRKRSSTHCFKYLPIMFKEETPVLPRQPLSLCDPAGMDFDFHHQLPPYPGTYSPPLPPHNPSLNTNTNPNPNPSPNIMSYHEDSGMLEDSPSPSDPRGSSSQHFHSLELGFTELLPPPPLYPLGAPQTPPPWLDSPYLSSSPSPSHSASLSPFPAGSPISSTSPFPHYSSSSSYGQDMCPSSPPSGGPYLHDNMLCPAPPPYTHQYDGWDPPPSHHHHDNRMMERDEAKGPEFSPLEFSSAPMHHITFEEVSEFIGEDIQSYQSSSQMDNQQN